MFRQKIIQLFLATISCFLCVSCDVADKDQVIFYATKVIAEQGVGQAQYKLGAMYAQGRGIPKDLSQAVDWYEKSASQGVPEAQYSLGRMYITGDGLPPDTKQAMYWFEKAASSGYAPAQFNLAIQYELEQGATKDTQKVIYWYEKAATQGYVNAQDNLADIFYKIALPNASFTRDYAFDKKYRLLKDDELLDSETSIQVATNNLKQAAYWYEKAAAQGSAHAQYQLGNIYSTGRGVTKDYQQAVVWFKKAADLGHVAAQNNLGVKYLKGEGVEQDLVQAYKWFNIAALYDDKFISETNRSYAEEKMNSKQIFDSHALAREWQKENKQ